MAASMRTIGKMGVEIRVEEHRTTTRGATCRTTNHGISFYAYCLDMGTVT